MKYALIDLHNTFHRGKHVAARGSDAWTKLGLSLHIIMASVNKVVKDFDIDHVVFANEGRSWRKDFYAPYKRNRKEARSARTEEQVEEDELFFEAFDDLISYLHKKTACSVIRSPNAEADDVIARWIYLHPDDEHVIISSDSDYYQLITDRVTQFNGITNEHITLDGVFNDRGKPVKDKKTGEQKQIGEPAWLLFEKCMRGDSSDNIFSAYPGVRTKGTKNKVGLQEAFADRDSKGYNWNNLMLQRWTDHEGEEHRVLDTYNRNRQLIDLTAQPDNIKDDVDLAIVKEVRTEPVSQTGIHFMKFCGKYQLTRLSDNATEYGRWLGKAYQGELKDVHKELGSG